MQLNTLGAKVAKNVVDKIQLRPLRDDKKIFSQFINLGETKISKIIVSDSVKSFDLSADLKSKIKCEREKKPVGIEIYQSGWTRYQRPNWYLNNELIVYCLEGKDVVPISNYSYIVEPSFEVVRDIVRIKQINARIVKCDIGEISCFNKQIKIDKFLQQKKESREKK